MCSILKHNSVNVIKQICTIQYKTLSYYYVYVQHKFDKKNNYSDKNYLFFINICSKHNHRISPGLEEYYNVSKLTLQLKGNIIYLYRNTVPSSHTYQELRF